jgi:hypothetical protein
MDNGLLTPQNETAPPTSLDDCTGRDRRQRLTTQRRCTSMMIDPSTNDAHLTPPGKFHHTAGYLQQPRGSRHGLGAIQSKMTPSQTDKSNWSINCPGKRQGDDNLLEVMPRLCNVQTHTSSRRTNICRFDSAVAQDFGKSA